MTERERILAAIDAIAGVEMNRYWELLIAQDRHRETEGQLNRAREALHAYDAEHPEEIPVPPEVTLEDLV